MHKGFNFKTRCSFSGYYTAGVAQYNNTKIQIRDTLDSYIGFNGVINGSKLQNDWFPTIEANIFLSHSHRDEDLAIKFAGFLYEEYGLITFIDSCIWGYANKLLKTVDKEYCWKESTKTYDYDKRNYSTSHIHIMLSTALTKMIDKCECIIFLNTENSITKTKEAILDEEKQKTYSPWIYSEISTIDLIRKNPLPPDRIKKKVDFSKDIILNESYSKSLQIAYDVDKELTKLPVLDDDILTNWKTLNKHTQKIPAVQATDYLDNLYLLYSGRRDKLD